MKPKYKVVKRRSRMSAMINGNSKYSLQYYDGDSVYANENTLGVFVFETLKGAEQWMWHWNDGREDKDLIILKVFPVGRGKKLRFIAESIDTEALDMFYHGEKIMNTAPDRTMAYPGVFVIGEYEYAR